MRSSPEDMGRLGGQDDATAPVLMAHIKGGTLNPLGVASANRNSALGEVPTLAEQGFSDTIAENWYGLLAPAGTPPAVVAKLNSVAIEAMRDPAVKEKLAVQGAILTGDTPEHFRGFIDSEIKKWAKVIKDAGVVTEK